MHGTLTGIKAVGAAPPDGMSMIERPLIDLAQESVLSLRDETQFAPNGIVSRVLLNTPAARVVLFGFAEGQELSEHTSTSHALIQILSGRCEFSLAGVPRILSAGELLYMPPHLPHAVKAIESFSMLLTLIKSSEPVPVLTRIKAPATATF
jgi:quercetin dioxygenase-like cupin family protein